MANPVVSPETYNIYDKGYRTGAQTSIFIGPIWVEEVLQLQLSTGTNDQPVYPYASPYYDRLLLGKYIVSGSIGITYTEPDYLLRVIELARGESITESELHNLIERRKSIFANSVKYKLLTEKVLQQGSLTQEDLAGDNLTSYITNYVDRITREIETTSLRGDSLDPQNFELTVIRGNPYDTSQSIEIYEGIKIVGTASVVTNDDNALMEVYSFTGRKKPDRTVRTPVPKADGYFSIDNLLTMAVELASSLIDALLDPPVIDVRKTLKRTTLANSTDKIALAGILSSNTQMSGKEAQFLEIIWDIEYNKKYTERNRIAITATTPLALFKKGTGATPIEVTSPSTPVTLMPPEWEGIGTHFDNSFGRLVSPDRLGTSKYISAIARVVPAQLHTKLGGSIVLPRYKRNNMDVGSFIPPKLIPEDSTFSFMDQQIPDLTVSTLWTCTTGFRNTPSIEHPQHNEEKQEEGPSYVGEVAQPIFGFAYIERIRGIYDDTYFGFAISQPVYLDYKEITSPEPVTDSNTDTSSDFRAKGTFAESEYDKDIIIPNYIDKDEDMATYITDKGEDKIEVNVDPAKGDEIDISFVVLKPDEINIEDIIDDDGSIPIEWADGPKEDAAHLNPSAPPPYIWKVGDKVRVGLDVYECNDDHEKENTFEDENGIIFDYWDYVGVWFDPHIREVKKTIDNSRLVTDLGKCLYVRPFVLTNKGEFTKIEEIGSTGVYEGKWNPPNDFPTDIEGDDKKQYAAELAWYLNKESNQDRDDTCDFYFDYRWAVKNTSGFTTQGVAMTIEILYFIRPKDDDWEKVDVGGGKKVKQQEILRKDNGQPGPRKVVNVYWLVFIAPTKKTDVSESNKDRSVIVKHDMQGLSGRKLELYNITRCDILQIPKIPMYAWNPENSILKGILNALIQSFENLINIWWPTPDHMFPVHSNMGRVSAFLRGYACNINVDNITEQILEATFSDDSQIHTVVGDPPNTEGQSSQGWTLRKALANAINERDSSNNSSREASRNAKRDAGEISDDIYVDLASSIRATLKEKVKQRGMKVIDDNSYLGRQSSFTGITTIYRDNITPAPAVISWGLTEDGYKELKNIEAINITSSAIVLGGYTN